MSKLDIAERRLPQDGRMSVRLGGRSIDLRISTMPSSHGERVVMRLLDKDAGKLQTDDLGMPQRPRRSWKSWCPDPMALFWLLAPRAQVRPPRSMPRCSRWIVRNAIL